MKQKIKEALKQKYGTRANKELGQLQLGLSDEVFERVAASVETFITDESAIEAFVGSESTLNLLKSYQSVADKARAEAKANPEPPKPSDNGNKPSDPEPNPKPAEDDKVPAWAQALIDSNKALSDSNKALSDKIATFETERDAKAALSTAEATFKGNDYVKKYADEATDAWERATEMYEATGKKWSAQELQEKAMGYFNKAVGKKGIDTTKPFSGDGGSGDGQTDYSSFDRAAKELGWEMPENK